MASAETLQDFLNKLLNSPIPQTADEYYDNLETAIGLNTKERNDAGRRIRDLEDKTQHLHGERQGFKESLNIVSQGVAKMAMNRPSQKAIHDGPKKPCPSVARGQVCFYGKTCRFSHTVTQPE